MISWKRSLDRVSQSEVPAPSCGSALPATGPAAARRLGCRCARWRRGLRRDGAAPLAEAPHDRLVVVAGALEPLERRRPGIVAPRTAPGACLPCASAGRPSFSTSLKRCEAALARSSARSRTGSAALARSAVSSCAQANGCAGGQQDNRRDPRASSLHDRLASPCPDRKRPSFPIVAAECCDRPDKHARPNLTNSGARRKRQRCASDLAHAPRWTARAGAAIRPPAVPYDLRVRDPST